MVQAHIEDLSAELQAVLAAIGKFIRDKRITPEVVNSIPNTRGSIIAAHEVSINYVAGKRVGPRTGRYIVTISGPRVNAQCQFRSFELERLSRLVDETVGRASQVDSDGELGALPGRVRSAEMDLNNRMLSRADDNPPAHMAGTHYDDQAERYPGQAPEDFSRGTGPSGHVNPDRAPDDELSADPEMNILPTDAKGG